MYRSTKFDVREKCSATEFRSIKYGITFKSRRPKRHPLTKESITELHSIAKRRCREARSIAELEPRERDPHVLFRPKIHPLECDQNVLVRRIPPPSVPPLARFRPRLAGVRARPGEGEEKLLIVDGLRRRGGAMRGRRVFGHRRRFVVAHAAILARVPTSSQARRACRRDPTNARPMRAPIEGEDERYVSLNFNMLGIC